MKSRPMGARRRDSPTPSSSAGTAGAAEKAPARVTAQKTPLSHAREIASVNSSGYSWPPGLEQNLLWFALGRFRPRDPIKLFTYLAERFGDLAHYKIGPRHVVLVNHPDYVREVLVTHNDKFVKERTVQRMKMLVGNGLITSEGVFHRRQRQLSQPAFHRQRIAEYAHDMVRLSSDFPQKKNWEDGSVVDISREMMELTLAIIAKTLFGVDLGKEVGEIGAAVNTIMDLYHFLIMLPNAEALEPLPIPGLMRFRRARARLDRTVYRMISEHHQRSKENGGGDLLTMLLRARDDEEGGDHAGMSDEQLRDEIMTIFLAGYETVANALTWTWYLLSENPEVETQLHREIAETLAGRNPVMEDLPRLKYAEMVLAESMRLYPPAWAQGRVSVSDFDLGGYHMPAGTNVFMSQFLIHRDSRFFPDPLLFDPQRWTPEAKGQRPKFSYFPFGGGARQCIGESFAWMEATLVLATIAQRWKLTLVKGHRVALLPLITLRAKYGMRMTLARR